MRIEFFKALWGMTGSLAENLEKLSAAGYRGVEHVGIPPMEPRAWWELLARFGLKATILVGADEAASGRQNYEAAAAFRPELIMSHTGFDRYDFATGKKLFGELLAVEADLGVRVVHETHRHRLFYSPFSTLPYLREFPALKVLADFSHWCVVCESKLEGLDEFLEPAIAASHHVHVRVGYDQGPQVPDPAAPQYREFLEAHERWWDAIKAARERDGTEVLIFTPEFGPPPYMQTRPDTGEPLADIWEIALWMRRRLAARWHL